MLIEGFIWQEWHRMNLTKHGTMETPNSIESAHTVNPINTAPQQTRWQTFIEGPKSELDTCTTIHEQFGLSEKTAPRLSDAVLDVSSICGSVQGDH